MNENVNPLSKYYRNFKISTHIPSNGKGYPDDYFDFTITNQLQVRGMTIQDDLKLSNPDALLNGQAIMDLIKSCVPGVKGDPRLLYICDISALLLAIQYASKGDDFDIKINCPKCSHENEFTRSIRAVLENMNFLPKTTYVKIDDHITVFVQPHRYPSIINQGLIQIEEARIMRLANDEKLSEKEKLKQFGEIFNLITEDTIKIVADGIAKIKIIEDEQTETVTNYDFIVEYISQLDKKNIEKIKNKIVELNDTGIETTAELTCQNEKCQHVWTQKNLTYDPTNFFTRG